MRSLLNQQPTGDSKAIQMITAVNRCFSGVRIALSTSVQRRFGTVIVMLLSAGVLAPASASVIGGYGAFTEVRTCPPRIGSTSNSCPGPGGTDETRTAGGEFATSASVSTSAGNTTGTGHASVAFTGDVFAPSLSAFASTPVGSRNAAESFALAIQSWTYTGAVSADYSVLLELTGSFDTSAGTNADAGIEARIAVYTWDDAEFFSGDLSTFLLEILTDSGGTLLHRDSLFMGPNFTLGSATFDFTANPGDQLYMFATLEAESSHGGIADASSTLNVSFVGGDTRSLTALNTTGSTTATVPEPTTLFLLLPFTGLLLARKQCRRV